MTTTLRLSNAHSLLLAAFLIGIVVISPALLAEENQQAKDAGKPAKLSWKKIEVERVFRSEGVGVGDINKDGKLDIVIGDVWYEAPDWKRHTIREERPFDSLKYSECFGCFVDDLNGDDSGIGTQFTVVDLDGDGLLDIVVANKKGVHAFLQVRN